jgi:DNA-directed RNA polymerase I and III subunit RPAC2
MFISPKVAFCGYSTPHPSEKKIHFRIQTRSKDYTALMALQQGLDDLMYVCDYMLKSVDTMVSSSTISSM